MRHRRLPLLATALAPALLLAALLLPGCSGLATYGEDRVRDLSDVLDVRYGTGFGLGLSAQFGEVFRTGLGCSTEWYRREWFGRKSVVVRDGLFAHGLIFGVDGDYVNRQGTFDQKSRGSSTMGTYTFLIFDIGNTSSGVRTGYEDWFTRSDSAMPSLSTGRIGGAIFLPGVNGGLYFSLGEAVDFLCGLVTFDLMNDDGYPKFFTPGTPDTPTPTPAPEPAPAPAPAPTSAPAPGT